MKKPIRILHCIAGLPGNGAERQLTYLCQGLSHQGHEVHTAVLRYGVHRARLEQSDSRIHRLPALGNYDPWVVVRLCRLIRELRPAVVQTWLPLMDVYSGTAARLTGVPWVLSERCSARRYGRFPRDQLRAGLARGASAVISNSRSGDAYWGTRLSDAIPRFVIPNSLPFEEIQAVEPIDRASVGLRNDQVLLLSAGRLTPRKNVGRLLRALPQILKKLDAVLVVLSDGTSRSSLISLADRLGIGDRVRFEGYVDNVWSWMKAADVFVSLSLFEGMPNSVMEAIACGCRLVLSNIVEHQDIVTDDQAILVDPNCTRDIAAAVHEAAQLCQSVGRPAIHPELQVGPWRISASAEAYCTIYEVITGRQAGREVGQGGNLFAA